MMATPLLLEASIELRISTPSLKVYPADSRSSVAGTQSSPEVSKDTRLPTNRSGIYYIQNLLGEGL